MPTSLPPRRRKCRPVVFLLWAIAILLVCAVIEIADPAPMDLAASWIAAP